MRPSTASYAAGGAQMAFGPGTVLGQDGVWELSNRAQQRLKHISHLASDPTTAPPVRRRAQSLLRDGSHSLINSSVSWRPDGDETGSNGKLRQGQARRRWRFPSTGLPCEVRCPRCECVNRIDEDLVRQARERLAEEES